MMINLEEQRRIAGILSAADRKLELERRSGTKVDLVTPDALKPLIKIEMIINKPV